MTQPIHRGRHLKLSSKMALFGVLLLTVAWATTSSRRANAATPQYINYQGFLKENNIPVNTAKPVLFRICDTDDCTGTVFCSENVPALPITYGRFSYRIGTTCTLSGITWGSGAKYLQITVDGNVLSPSELITSSPFSLSASGTDETSFTLDYDNTAAASATGTSITFNRGSSGAGVNPVLKWDESGSGYLLSYNGTDAASATVGLLHSGAIESSATLSGTRLISTVATGTAPMLVTSGTAVTNLNADMLDGYHYSDIISSLNGAAYVLKAGDSMTGALTMSGAGGDIIFDNAGGAITLAGGTITDSAGSINLVDNTAVTGIFSVSSTSTFSGDVTIAGGSDLIFNDAGGNISNTTGDVSIADTLDVTGAVTMDSTLGVTGAITGANTVQGTRMIFSQATGTAPFTVTSGTLVTNLNADAVDGYSAGNAAMRVPISNGVVNTSLNADMVDGKHYSDATSDFLNVSGDTMTGALMMDQSAATSTISAYHTGVTSHAGHFENTNASNTMCTLYAVNSGGGESLCGIIEDIENSSTAMIVSNAGLGRGSTYTISNAANTSAAIYVNHQGNGSNGAVEIVTSNGANAFYSHTTGTAGRAGKFYIDNASNDNDVVYIETASEVGGTTLGRLIDTNKGAYLTNTGVWTSASSRKYKKDITPLTDDDIRGELDVVKNIQVVRYRYNSESTEHRKSIGVIAEEAPDDMTDDTKEGVQPTQSIAMLIAAVQAQQKLIEELRAEIEALKAASAQ